MSIDEENWEFGLSSRTLTDFSVSGRRTIFELKNLPQSLLCSDLPAAARAPASPNGVALQGRPQRLRWTCAGLPLPLSQNTGCAGHTLCTVPANP